MTLKELLNKQPELRVFKLGTVIDGDSGLEERIIRRTVRDGELILTSNDDNARYTPIGDGLKVMRVTSWENQVRVKDSAPVKPKVKVKGLTKKQMFVNQLDQLRKLVNVCGLKEYTEKLEAAEAKFKRMRK